MIRQHRRPCVAGFQGVVVRLGEIAHPLPEDLADHVEVRAPRQHGQAGGRGEVLFQQKAVLLQVPDGGPVGGHGIAQTGQV